MTNDIYDQQALDFLTATGAKIEVKLATNQTCPNWGKCEPFRFSRSFFNVRNAVTVPHNHGLEYEITISRDGRKPYTFSFWSSINNTYASEVSFINENPNMRRLDMQRVFKSAIKPTAYDVLACLSCDIDIHNFTFEEFCDNSGYNSDSKQAEKTYNAICNQSRALARLFSDQELDQLREIQ